MTVVIQTVQTATPELVTALERLLPQLVGRPTPVDEGRLGRVLAQEAVTLLIARDEGGEIVGTATVVVVATAANWVARLEEVVVDASARGKGVGAALTSAAISVARDGGVEHLELTTAPRREAANRLYQRLGFQRRETNVYRHPLTKSTDSAT